jgi:hypothetical protein
METDMTRISRAICIGVLSAGAAGALGFGAAQAFAAPSTPVAATLSCSDERCDAICVSRGYAYGDCSTGACRCFR